MSFGLNTALFVIKGSWKLNLTFLKEKFMQTKLITEIKSISTYLRFRQVPLTLHLHKTLHYLKNLKNQKIYISNFKNHCIKLYVNRLNQGCFPSLVLIVKVFPNGIKGKSDIQFNSNSSSMTQSSFISVSFRNKIHTICKSIQPTYNLWKDKWLHPSQKDPKKFHYYVREKKKINDTIGPLLDLENKLEVYLSKIA